MEKRYKTITILALLLLFVGTPSMQAQWVEDGVAICTAPGHQYDSQITSDGAGGAIITWEDWRSGRGDIYCQRYDRDGVIQGHNFRVNDDAGSSDQYNPAIDVDGNGKNDIVGTGYRANSVGWYKQISATSWIEYTIDSNLLNAHDAKVGDIDDDGKEDIVGIQLSEILEAILEETHFPA